MVAVDGGSAEFGGEEMNKPEWRNAPDWAEWMAQDEDGQWGWYENEPPLGSWSWIWEGGEWADCNFDGRSDDWTASLEPRP